MIVIATSSFIICKGLIDILKELYTGKKILCVNNAGDLEKLKAQNTISLLLASSDILSSLKMSLYKENQIIKLIHTRPDYIETDSENYELLFLDDAKEPILRVLKRNLAVMDKNSTHNKTDSVLSDRELDIVREVALGKTNKEIADKLFISAHTVITHRKNITRKLGIKTVSGLTVYALLNKLIKMSDSL